MRSPGPVIATVAAVAIPMALLAVFFAWPVGAMLARGIAPRAFEALGSDRTWELVATTLRMAAIGTLGSVLLGVPGAYALYVCRFPGQRALRAVATVPFVLPTVVVGVAFRSVLGKEGAYSWLELDGTETAVVAAMVFFNFSVIVRTVGAMWAGLDPRSADAARMLGAGPIKIFRTVTLPALMPAIASGASLVFLFCSTAYGIVMTLGGVSTLESEIWARTNRLNFDVAAGLSLAQFVIVALALVVSSRISHSMPLPMANRKLRMRRADLPAVTFTVGVIVTLIVAPMASLVARSFMHEDRWSLENYRQLATAGSGFTGGVTVIDALGNSMRAAGYATLVALGIGIPLAFALSRPTRSRRGRFWQRLAEGFAMAPLGVSSVTVGFGFLIALRGPPLQLGSEAVPFAQAIVAVPMVLRALLPVLRAIDPRLREAAALLGAGSARVARTVDLVLAARGLALAVGFALAISLGEFGASSFLVSGENDTLPVLISRLLNRPGADNYGMALAASVILGLLTAFIMFVCEARRDPSSSSSSSGSTSSGIEEGLVTIDSYSSATKEGLAAKGGLVTEGSAAMENSATNNSSAIGGGFSD